MGKKIMIVDDSVSIRQMVHFTLKEAGYEIYECVDGSDAVYKVKLTKPDMFITDLNMPKMDGLELIKNLRAMAEFKFTPIIMLTTESQEEKKLEGKKVGATGWIVKPFNPAQLIAVVKRVLG